MELKQEIDIALRRELERLVEDIKAKHIELEQKASGKWLDSLEVRVENGHGVILAEDYTRFLTVGRAPGKKPPIDPLEKWVNDKFGITGKKARGVAFAVAYNIGEKGTKRIYQKGGTDLIDGVVTKERIAEIQKNIGKKVAAYINQSVARSFENLIFK